MQQCREKIKDWKEKYNDNQMKLQNQNKLSDHVNEFFESQDKEDTRRVVR